MKLSRILWITGGCLAVLAGCSSTKTMVVPSADLSGFLSGYTELRRGGDGEPAHVYRKPGWNVALYDQVILEPIEIWRGEESRRKG